MKPKIILNISSCIIGIMFLSASLGICGTTLPVQKKMTPAVQSQAPARQTQPVPAPVSVDYMIRVEGIKKNNQCYVSYILRNTGANLTVDQHKRSYTQFGNESRVSLAAVDPEGKLRIKGNTAAIKTGLHPTGGSKKYYKRIITVTLFNGKEIKKMVLVTDACPTELPSATPQAAAPQTVAPQPELKKEAIKSMPQALQEKEPAVQEQPPQEIPNAKVRLKSSRKVPLSPQLQAIPSAEPQGKTKPTVRDLTCSIAVSYDQNGTNLIQSTGPTSGTYIVSSPYPTSQALVWTHVKVDYQGEKGERERMSTFKLHVQFQGFRKKVVWGHTQWVPYTRDFNYDLSMDPGEAREYSFYSNPWANYNSSNQMFSSKTVTAEVDTGDAVNEVRENNNKCMYKISFKK